MKLGLYRELGLDQAFDLGWKSGFQSKLGSRSRLGVKLGLKARVSMIGREMFSLNKEVEVSGVKGKGHSRGEEQVVG